MKRMLIAFSALTLMFTACKKDDVKKEVTPTKENLTGTWMVTSVKISNASGSMDLFSSFEACEKDDIYHLNADLSFEYEDAGTQCSPNNIYSGGTWALTSSTTIDIDGDVSTIKSFDGKTLVASQSDGDVTQSITYVKQ
jgi:hypothetical protein